MGSDIIIEEIGTRQAEEMQKMKELFTIGEMGELFQINIRTLRYYDEIGLLKPEMIKEQTGYRYYSTKQFERLNAIKYLRTLDMPLEKIKQFFENKDARTMKKILEEQLEETRRQLQNLQTMERKLNVRLNQLNQALNAPLGQIREMRLDGRPVAYLRKTIRQGEDLEYPIRELERMNHLQPVMFLGKVGVSIGIDDLKAREYSRFSGIFVFLEQEDNYQGEQKVLGEGEYLSLLYSGTHQESARYYDRLFEYMRSHNYSLIGDSVEITWIDAGFTDDVSQYVTELQIPVKRE